LLGAGNDTPRPGGGGTANGGQKYTVVSGDSLSLISKKFWGDLMLWPILYDANRQTVGSDPNRIEIGQRLSIPNIKSYSNAQLTDARSRGRNWR
jgi:nucleoid-associated protein YgaU